MQNDEDWPFADEDDGADRRRDPARRDIAGDGGVDDRDAFDLGGDFYSARWNNVARDYGDVRKLEGRRLEEYSRYQKLNDFERERFFDRKRDD